MPFSSSRRRLPFRDRSALLERQRELTAAAVRVDGEQQRLAVEFSELRRELQSIRDTLWPAHPGHAFSMRGALASPARRPFRRR